MWAKAIEWLKIEHINESDFFVSFLHTLPE